MVVVEVEGWGFTTCSRVWGMSRIRVFGALWGTGPGLPRSKRTSEPNGKEARSVGFHQSHHLVFKTKTNQTRTRVYSNKTTTPKHTRRKHMGAVKALAWCPWQPTLLASGGGTHDAMIHVWNCNTGSRVHSIETPTQVTSLHFAPMKKELLSTHGYPQFLLTSLFI